MKEKWVSTVRRVDKPWGHEEVFALSAGKYCGKAIHVTAGHALSLQYHEQKEETIAIFSGTAFVEVGKDEAELDGFSNLGPIADLVPDYQFTSVVVDQAWAAPNRALVTGFLRALRRGTDYMFAHGDESAELGSRELKTSVAFARRALDDTARMDILSRDLAATDKSLRRVFDSVKSADLVPPDTPYDRARFVDESYLGDAKM